MLNKQPQKMYDLMIQSVIGKRFIDEFGKPYILIGPTGRCRSSINIELLIKYDDGSEKVEDSLDCQTHKLVDFKIRILCTKSS